MTSAAELIPAAGYKRKSTQKQEQSIPAQHEAIEKFAVANGYKIIRWYTENGISGATGGQRPEFLRMLRDAEEIADFKFVICYDLSRFGRMDNDETGYYRHRLKQAGVRVVFSNENDGGNDESGEIIRPVLQAQKRQLLRQISRDTSRGMVQCVRSGWATGRAAPFGFDRMLVDENGQHRKRLKRGQKESKPREWHTILVPTDDVAELVALRWIFDSYAARELSCREIARQLNDRGLRSPHGRSWGASTIREILRNPAYKGDLVFGRKSEGKFNRIINGEVRPADPAEGIVRRSLDQCIVTHRPEMAIVSPEKWDAVNRVFSKRADRHLRARSRRLAYPLSGRIYCAECGAPMTGMSRWDKKIRTPIYSCSTKYRNGACHSNSIREDRLIDVLRAVILEKLFCNGNMEKFKAALLRRASARVDSRTEDRLKVELAEAKSALDRASRNLLLADSENVPSLNKIMSELRHRVTNIDAQLADAKRTGDASEMAEAAVARARELVRAVLHAPPEKLKSILGSLVEKIEVRFEPAAWGRRRIRRVAGCELLLRDSLTINGRGDRI